MMNPAEFANIAAAEREFWWYRGMREILYRMLDPIARANEIRRVCEAGCGTGYFSKLLAERYGWTMFPLDVRPEGLDHARDQGTGRLTQGDIMALPFSAAAFDALVSLDVIPHLEPGMEHQALAEFSRVLRPDGLLMIRTPAFDFLRSRHSEFVHEKQRFTRSHLTAAAARAGFRMERVTYANALLLPVAAFKFRIWEPLTRQTAASGVQPAAGWLDRFLYLPLQMEAAWIGRGGAFPAGQSLLLIARKGPGKPAAR